MSNITGQKNNPDGSVTTTWSDGSVTTNAPNAKATIAADNNGMGGNDALSSRIRDEGSAAAAPYRFGNDVNGLKNYTNRTDRYADAYSSQPDATVVRNDEVRSRGLQQAAATGYQGMVNGTGPSLATGMLNRGLSGVANQSSQAMANKNNPAAIRAAILGGNSAAGQVVNSATGQRVNEFNTGVNGLGSVAANMNAGDVKAYGKDQNFVLDNRKTMDDMGLYYAGLGSQAREIEMNAQAARARTQNGIMEAGNQQATEQLDVENARKDAERKAWVTAATGIATATANASTKG